MKDKLKTIGISVAITIVVFLILYLVVPVELGTDTYKEKIKSLENEISELNKANESLKKELNYYSEVIIKKSHQLSILKDKYNQSIAKYDKLKKELSHNLNNAIATGDYAFLVTKLKEVFSSDGVYGYTKTSDYKIPGLYFDFKASSDVVIKLSDAKHLEAEKEACERITKEQDGLIISLNDKINVLSLSNNNYKRMVEGYKSEIKQYQGMTKYLEKRLRKYLKLKKIFTYGVVAAGAYLVIKLIVNEVKR